MIKSLSFLAMVFLLSNCTTVNNIPYSKDFILKDDAVVRLTNDLEIDTDDINTKGDSLFVKGKTSNYQHKIAKTEISNITVTNHWEGAIYGGLAGIPILGIGSFFSALIWGIEGNKEIYKIDYNDKKQPIVENTNKSKANESSQEIKTNTLDLSPSRSDWYFGLNAGYGSIINSIKYKSVTSNSLPTSGDATHFSLKAGYTINQQLLLGINLSSLGTFPILKNGFDSQFTLLSSTAEITWFPYSKGFFTRSGIGFSSFLFESKRELDNYEYEPFIKFDSGGLALDGGIGYAFWIGQQFNLTISGDLKSHFDKKGSPQYWGAFSLGLMWY